MKRIIDLACYQHLQATRRAHVCLFEISVKTVMWLFNRLSTMDSAERELTHFFESLTQMQEKFAICVILYRQLIINRLKNLAKVFAVILVIYTLWQTFSCISWICSALLRIAFIQILPYWNWTTLYRNPCLLNRETIEVNLPNFASENCLLCASLEYVPKESNVTFSYLESEYLESGMPVVITDSHKPKSLTNFVNNMLEHSLGYLETEPCDVKTNLLLKERFNLELAFYKLDTASTAFLQLRNCEFDAVKLSRLFIEKPYFYATHLEPFHTSWLIISRNMLLPNTDLIVQGLILIQQWQGQMNVYLQPNEVCEKICQELKIRLFAGDALIFSTDLWHLSYNLLSKDEETLSTILEIDWKL